MQPWAAWTDRDEVIVEGPDALAFLQGQLSQDVGGLPLQQAAWSLLLEPDGKVTAWLRITRTGPEAFRLDVDAGHGPTVMARLERFKLRTKATIRHVGGVGCLTVRGVDPSTVPDEPTPLPSGWPEGDGYDVIDERRNAAPPPGVTMVGEDVFERERIRAGVPANGRELTPATIPAEAGAWLIARSVSFAKGCYTGQELVARMDSRGGTGPRPLRRLRVDGRVAAGAEVTHDGKVVGLLTSAAPDGDATVGLGPIARSVEGGTEVAVADQRAVVLTSA